MSNRGVRVDYKGNMKGITPKIEVLEGKKKSHNLSPRPGASFGWGADEKGGVETSRAILEDYIGSPPTTAEAKDFYTKVVSKIQGRAWGIFGWTVMRWKKGELGVEPGDEAP